MPERIKKRDIAQKLPAIGRVLVAGVIGESQLLARAVMEAGEQLGALAFTGIFVGGINKHTYLANARCSVETFFLTPELKQAPHNQVEFFPLCYNEILARLRTVQIDAVIVMVAPPGPDGCCSFGCAVDFAAELWERAPIRIAHINPAIPVTSGHPGIPFHCITAFIEEEEALSSIPGGGNDALSNAIAFHAATIIADGSTLQMGLGTIPSAILRALTSKRDIRVHSGMISEAVLELIASGSLARSPAITGGVAIGSKSLYAAASGQAFQFRPVSYTHDAVVISGLQRFVAINSAIEVDLYGQAYSELSPNGLMSGPGGASDFARGAHLGHGLSIVALASTARKGAISRIVGPSAARGPIALGRFDVDFVVTEYGVADIRQKSHDARAAELISVAAPAHRDELSAAWAELSATF